MPLCTVSRQQGGAVRSLDDIRAPSETGDTLIVGGVRHTLPSRKQFAGRIHADGLIGVNDRPSPASGENHVAIYSTDSAGAR